MLIFTGDMNTNVGEENWDYDKVMGKHGLEQEMKMEKGCANFAI